MRRKTFVGTLAFLAVVLSTAFSAPVNAAPGDSDDKDRAAALVSEQVVINEVATRGPLGVLDEFVEFRNIGNRFVDLSGFEVIACSPGGQEISLLTLPQGTFLAPQGQQGQYLLAARLGTYSRAMPPDLFYRANIPSAGGVYLRDQFGNLTDAVGFAPGLICTEGQPAQLQVANVDRSNERLAPQDTDNNAVDFRLRSPSTPQNQFSL